jgi:hypothetical protein
LSGTVIQYNPIVSKAEVKEFFEETLPTVGRKIDMMLGRSDGKLKYPVDCVAFGSASSSVRDGGHHHAICYHPDRGKQYGCLLTNEDEQGKITRKRGTECDFRIKKGRRGAVELNERIAQLEELLF